MKMYVCEYATNDEEWLRAVAWMPSIGCLETNFSPLLFWAHSQLCIVDNDHRLMAPKLQPVAASEMLHQLLEASVPSGPSTTTTSTGGDTWEDLSTASRDPASPSRSMRLPTLTDSFPQSNAWPTPWNPVDTALKTPYEDFFDVTPNTAGATGSLVHASDTTLPVSSDQEDQVTPDQLLIKECALEDNTLNGGSPPGFVSPALLAHALNILGAASSNTPPHDAFSPDSADGGVAEAAQLLARLLECSVPEPPSLVPDGQPSPPPIPSFATTNSFDPTLEGGSPKSAMQQHQQQQQQHPSFTLPWPAIDINGPAPSTATNTTTTTTEPPPPPLRLPIAPPPHPFDIHRRESNFSVSTPRSPAIVRPPPPPQDDDSLPSMRWYPGWPRWPRIDAPPYTGSVPASLGDGSPSKRVDSANSPTASMWQNAPSPSTAVDREGRSKVLMDFRNGTLQITNLYQIEKYMIEFSRDQMGARFIQQRLSCCSAQEAWFARSILTPRLKGLVTDVFGNHIVQRLIESGTAQQRHAIFLQLQGDILRFSLQTYGCRVLQKALEALSLEDKLAFAQELHNHVVRCVEDQNGNHVIQKCIERIPPAHMQFVIDAFQGQVARVSVHCYGCRVVQRVLEHCPFEQINGLLDEIMEDFIRLAQDQYGNYVVQHVLRYGRPEDKKVIVDRIAKDLQLLASHKFSSNVVEKCLEVCTAEDQRRTIIRAAFGDNNDPRPPIMQMVRDRYANYVVQRMIDVTIQDGQEALIDEVIAKLEKHMPALKKFTYGKHIAAALERLRKQNEELRSRGTS